MKRIHIRGARVIDPANQIDQLGDVWIADGRIVGVLHMPVGFAADDIIDATALVVCPGLVDLRARPREPGHEHKATLGSECAAAVAGGVTTLCCPPDTDPVIDNPAVADLIHHRAGLAGKARVVTLGALTQGLHGTQLSEMHALKQAGCVGVSNALNAITDTQVMRRAMEYAASLDLTVFLHSEDPSLGGGVMHESPVSARLGLTGIPETAETIAVGRDLLLIQQTGVRAHFGNLSTMRAVQMVARVIYDGVPISADVTAHHLHLTDMDVGDFNANCHVRPPLRSARDRAGLITGLQRGTLAAICSDHQPHDADAKLAPFAETEPGISSIETLLPLSLRAGEEAGMKLSDLIARVTCGPARILGIGAGTLTVGAAADVCIFDPHAFWTVDETQLVSQGRNTPFTGWELQGQVRYTLVGGRIVFQN